MSCHNSKTTKSSFGHFHELHIFHYLKPRFALSKVFTPMKSELLATKTIYETSKMARSEDTVLAHSGIFMRPSEKRMHKSL